MGEKYRSHVGNTVTIRVAEQNYLIGARDTAAGLRLKKLEEKSADASRVVGTPRCVRFRDENIAVRQNVQPARMVETARKCRDAESLGGMWPVITTPTFRGDDIDERDRRNFTRRGRQLRRRSNACCHR
jgi:hypothetical protein